MRGTLCCSEPLNRFCVVNLGSDIVQQWQWVTDSGTPCGLELRKKKKKEWSLAAFGDALCLFWKHNVGSYSLVMSQPGVFGLYCTNSCVVSDHLLCWELPPALASRNPRQIQQHCFRCQERPDLWPHSSCRWAGCSRNILVAVWLYGSSCQL